VSSPRYYKTVFDGGPDDGLHARMPSWCSLSPRDTGDYWTEGAVCHHYKPDSREDTPRGTVVHMKFSHSWVRIREPGGALGQVMCESPAPQEWLGTYGAKISARRVAEQELWADEIPFDERRHRPIVKLQSRIATVARKEKPKKGSAA